MNCEYSSTASAGIFLRSLWSIAPSVGCCSLALIGGGLKRVLRGTVTLRAEGPVDLKARLCLDAGHGGIPFLRRHLLDRLGEAPDVPFRIDGAIAAVAI